MELEKLIDAGRTAFAKVSFIEPAQHAEEIKHGCMTDDIKRVVEAERRIAINVTADKQR